jgi:hypothetical protein
MTKHLVATTLLCVIFLAGCTTVAPWERGDLAKPQMALDPSPVRSALRIHKFTSREAASGGDTAVGGGCGCN